MCIRDSTERGAIYDEMNRVIAALHTVKFAERGLAAEGAEHVELDADFTGQTLSLIHI